MFRLPSWISDARGADKAVNGEAHVGNILLPSMAKRKRDVSDEPLEIVSEIEQETKRRKLDATQNPNQRQRHVDAGNMTQEQSGASSHTERQTSRLRETIEAQFNLEILLKHNELRLINQELGKCQIALEQLRRCHLIPYPASQSTASSMLAISNGSVPAIQQRDGADVPQWAPSYGVADGPYSRHYAKWLIPDASFDGEQFNGFQGLEASRAGGKTVSEGRTTRNSFADGSTPTSKARLQRGSASQKLQALSSGYPQPKEKAGPCTLKRMSDHQWVKLVCVDCQRENFSSTQGFINHCRIAHHREFKSHEEAAIHSGVPIEVDEVTGGIVGEEKAPPVLATGLVHPLVRNTSADPAVYRSLLSHIQDSLAAYEKGELPGVSSIPGKSTTPHRAAVPTVTPSKSFVPSSDTPHLSALMRSRGFSGNLSEIVGEIKKPIEFDEFSQGEESEDSERPRDQPQFSRSTGLDGTFDSPPAMRVPARATMSPAPFNRPGSAKGPDGFRKTGISPRPSYATPIINTAAASYNKMSDTQHDLQTIHDISDHDMMDIDSHSLIDLSPNTVASNNAPSLVSDDGEYDEGDDADSASEDEGDEDSVAEISIEDGEAADKMVARTVGNGKKEERHVSFVGPVKEKGATRK